MRFLKSNLLNNGKLFNDGRPVDVIQIESEKDFDLLLENIICSQYYDTAYFDSHIDYREGEIKFDSLFLSSILKFLNPKSLLELGCGRGDVLFLLDMDAKITVRGIEFSRDVLKKVWSRLKKKVDLGDILEICQKYYSRKVNFDTFCAFDLWEHLHPKKLHEYIDAVVALAEKDALFFFNIPAVGEDKIFGEIFPLELEGNRRNYNQRLPFDFLNAELINPPIPANGHLIWAHTEWWQKQFERHGLIRAETLEKTIHTSFDEHLFYARKSFYVFYLNTQEARRRANRLTQKGLTLYRKWKLLVDQQESIGRFLKTTGKSFIDLAELKSTINHAELYMILDIKNQIERWTWKPLQQKKTGCLIRPLLSRLEKYAYEYFNWKVHNFKKRHYLVV
jgi:SAM-dependent methyltransferase